MRPGAISHLQVAAQFCGIALAAWPFAGTTRWPAAALVLGAAGALLGVLTLAHNRIGNFGVFPEPRAGARLVTTGPYARVRHPMYGALLLVVAGLVAWNAHALNAAGLALVAAAVVAKARREERFLLARFPDYAAYRRRTRWFVPFVL